jgi:hypothetical protein
LNIASYLADILPESQWDWTIKKIVTYADVKTYLGKTNAQKLRSGSGYNKFIVNMITDPRLYKAEFDDDEQSADFRDISNIAVGTYQTYEEFAESIREIAYSPSGIVASVVLEEIPFVNIIPVAAYAILLVDDILKISSGNWDGWIIFDLIFDALGVASIHPGIMKIIGKVLKGAFSRIIKPGAKITLRIMKYLLELFLKLSDDMLRLLERLFKSNFRGKLIKAIKSMGKSISDMLEKSGLKNLARIVRRKVAEAQLWIVGIYDLYIEPFCTQLYNVVKTILEFPGKTIEFYLEKLGYTYSKKTGKIVHKGVKTAAAVGLISVAFEHISEWVASIYWKSIIEQNAKRDLEEQKRFFCNWAKEIQNEVIATTKQETINVYGLVPGGNNKFELIGTYERIKDPTNSNYQLPIIIHMDRQEGNYIAATFYQNASRTEEIDRTKFTKGPNKGQSTYLFIKMSDINIVNKKPLKTYKWASGKSMNCN